MQIQDDKPYDDINITPMLDLAYVLLVIFILMCTAAVQGLKADLPQGSKGTRSLAERKVRAITINTEGKVFLDTSPVTLTELEARLAQIKAENPNVPIVVKGVQHPDDLAQLVRDHIRELLVRLHPDHRDQVHLAGDGVHLGHARHLGDGGGYLRDAAGVRIDQDDGKDGGLNLDDHQNKEQDNDVVTAEDDELDQLLHGLGDRS